MRIAVMGAGAVGGYFGARLGAGSNHVAYIARGSHLASLRRERLILESPKGNLQVRTALFTDNLAQVGLELLFTARIFGASSKPFYYSFSGGTP